MQDSNSKTSDRLTYTEQEALDFHHLGKPGKIEVRGLGIVELRRLSEIALAHVVDLVPSGSIERLPDAGQSIEINGIFVPPWRLAPFEAPAPAKLALALAHLAPMSG